VEEEAAEAVADAEEAEAALVDDAGDDAHEEADEETIQHSEDAVEPDEEKGSEA
jgi:hypothetical protein